jgi:carboxynorspermidine decarboxylase
MHQFESPLKVGRTLHIADAAGYSMVKKNWFNGLAMPSIVVKRLNGTIEVIRQFGYREYKASLS